MISLNCPTLEVLVRKCNAVFSDAYLPMYHLSLVHSSSKMLPLLQTLLRLRNVLPTKVLDPNVLHQNTTALHQAVRCDLSPLTDPDPRVAQLLIRGFGANLLLKDANGSTPHDRLTATAALVSRARFPTKAAYADWQARVAATKEILRGDDDDADDLSS